MERILSLDMSTKTGWALLVSKNDGTYELEQYGRVPQIHMPDGPYPGSFIEWAHSCFDRIMVIIKQTMPDVLVIEETSAGSKAVYTQKILEYIHFLIAQFIASGNIKAIYIMSEQWRRETGCVMSKEEKKKNKEVRDYKKKKAIETGVKPTVAKDKDGKRIGIVGRKHVNVRRANEVFGKFLKEPLKRKDEDTADSLLLGYCYHLRKHK